MGSGEAKESLKKGKAYCLRLLTLRPRSEREIETRLKKAGYSRLIREKILGSLKRGGLVNDLRFAREWIDSRLRESPRGRKLVRAELEEKGVPEAVIKEALEGREAELGDRAIATRLIRDRLRGGSIPRDIKLKGKLFRFLVGKGIEPDIAEEAIDDEL